MLDPPLPPTTLCALSTLLPPGFQCLSSVHTANFTWSFIICPGNQHSYAAITEPGTRFSMCQFVFVILTQHYLGILTMYLCKFLHKFANNQITKTNWLALNLGPLGALGVWGPICLVDNPPLTVSPMRVLKKATAKGTLRCQMCLNM